MKHIVPIEIDCANCARKLEDKLAKINGVTNVNVDFLRQRIVLEQDNSNPGLWGELAATCKKFDRKFKMPANIGELNGK